ncbi:IS110 family transposase [Gordonia neofelifaecis]|uniref:Transposase n=1 Tax=Gordonia neofelifaecis NRRL B-59395 TaxID=644548 RepID=F1YPT7_9ACTN|nr:IS110 family transposase [Gordonia neofelifaecis]EGD53307.1 transposase [Gordonia neofelifaecis NRRL B-59395]
MITVGVDVHKATHTFVAVDSVGAKIAETTVPATTAGHHRALAWARALLPSIDETDGPLWAVEDCRNMSNRLERDLLSAGQSVVRVSPHLMATHRRTGRERGKSDPIDALAVARAAQREPDLPVACHDEVTRALKLLTDHRDHQVVQRTSSINRLLWHLHELDPEFPGKADLTTLLTQKRIGAWLGERSGVLVEIATEELADIVDLSRRIKEISKRIGAMVTTVSPALLEIDGCGELTAAKILGEVANIDRFPGQDQLARYCGIAPVPVWSGRTEGTMRLTRAGNRQLDRAVHTIALTQARREGTLGHAYYERKLAEGMSKKQALRCLKRQIVRAVFRALETDHRNRTNPPLHTAA